MHKVLTNILTNIIERCGEINMSLDFSNMSGKIIEEWLNNHTDITPEEKNVFINVKKDMGPNVKLFYDMNRIIMQGEGVLEDSDVNIEFICKDGQCMLSTLYGKVYMESMKFRGIIGTFIETYEPIYPIGTVLKLKKEAFSNVLDISQFDELKVVVAHRFVPINNNRYIPYIGFIYPIGPTGVGNDALHFTAPAIEKVVHMGFSDEQEEAYAFNLKSVAIAKLDMHSVAFMTREELKQSTFMKK